MAQMKSMAELSEAIKSTHIPSDVAVIQKLLSSMTAATTALNALPSEYSRAYSQVQLLRYDQNNYPEDVTDPNAVTIPDSVIARYKQSWANIKENINSLRSQIEQFKVTDQPNMDTLRSQIKPVRGTFVYDGKFSSGLKVSAVQGDTALGQAGLAEFLANELWGKAIEGISGTLESNVTAITDNRKPLIVSDRNLAIMASFTIIKSSSTNFTIRFDIGPYKIETLFLALTGALNVPDVASMKKELNANKFSRQVSEDYYTPYAELSAKIDTTPAVDQRISLSIDLSQLDIALSNL